MPRLFSVSKACCFAAAAADSDDDDDTDDDAVVASSIALLGFASKAYTNSERIEPREDLPCRELIRPQ